MSQEKKPGAKADESGKPAEAKAEKPLPPVPQPKVAMLHRPKDPSGTPADVIPVAPVAVGSPVPRLLHQNERAPSGLRRYAVHSNDPPRPKRYVLARGADEAAAYYRRAAGVAEDREAELVVNEMSD